MNRKIKKYLFDILTCIQEIESFIEGREISTDSLRSDRKTLRAIERDLEIIGDPMKRILRLDPEIQISDTSEIIGARNYIAHEYESVSLSILSRTLTDHIPLLKKEVIELLAEK